MAENIPENLRHTLNGKIHQNLYVDSVLQERMISHVMFVRLRGGGGVVVQKKYRLPFPDLKNEDLTDEQVRLSEPTIWEDRVLYASPDLKHWPVG